MSKVQIGPNISRSRLCEWDRSCRVCGEWGKSSCEEFRENVDLDEDWLSTKDLDAYKAHRAILRAAGL